MYYEYKVYPILDGLLGSALPFIIIVVCNVAISVRLLLHRRKRAATQTSSSASAPKLTSMTAMLLTTSFVFLLLTLPLNIYSVGEAYWLATARANNDRNMLADVDLAVGCTYILLYINCACNFFLYVLSGPRFRAELKNIFSRGVKTNRIHAITVASVM